MAFNLFTRAQSNPSLPGNLPNPNFQYQDLTPTLDGIFDAYMKIQQDKRAAGLAALQTQQLQGAIAGQQQEQALRSAQQTAQFGAPLASYTPQQMTAAAGTAPLDQGMGPLTNERFGALQRLRDGLAKLGGRDPMTLEAQGLARRKTESEIAENQAQADEIKMRASGGHGVAEQFYTDPDTGMKFRIKPGHKGNEYIPLPGQAIGADGKVVFTTNQTKEDRPGQGEYSARGFADKAQQAHDALSAIEAKGFNPAAKGNLVQSMLPTMAQSPDFQSSDQARRQFVNAILRRDSGAAIPPFELENYTRQYFPVPGDSPAVLQQKAAARQLAIANLEQEGARVPSAIPQGRGPQVGAVEDGYRFKGGNPSDPNAWEKI